MNKIIILFVIIMIALVVACSSGFGVGGVKKTEFVKPSKTVQKVLTNQDYLLEVSPLMLEFGECYSRISKHCDNKDIVKVGEEIKRLKELKKELKQLKEPPEFKEFESSILNTVDNWDKAYKELLLIEDGKQDLTDLNTFIEKANKNLDLAMKIIKEEV